MIDGFKITMRGGGGASDPIGPTTDTCWTSRFSCCVFDISGADTILPAIVTIRCESLSARLHTPRSFRIDIRCWWSILSKVTDISSKARKTLGCLMMLVMSCCTITWTVSVMGWLSMLIVFNCYATTYPVKSCLKLVANMLALASDYITWSGLC